MIRSATLFLFFVAAHICSGQQALIDNQEGQWCIVANGEKQFLDREIQELGNFDQAGLTYFMRHEKYGILNEQGEVVLEEEYSSIKQLDGGYYVLLKDKNQTLANWKESELQFRTLIHSDELQENWLLTYIDSTRTLINLEEQKEWVLLDGDRIYESDFNHLYCSVNGQMKLLDENGSEVDLGETTPLFAEDYLLLNTPNSKRVIYRGHEVTCPSDAKTIQVRENEILYTQNGSSTIVSALDGKHISKFPYENLEYYNNTAFRIRENGKVGLIKKSGELLIPPNYTSIWTTGGLFAVRTSNGAGMLDAEGNELIPCVYSYVVAYSDFFTVHNNINLAGVISRKTGKTMLPCVYDRLMLSDTIIRAFTSDLLRILELDSNHRIVNDLVLSNVTSLANTNASIDPSVDKRLFPLGWYIENIPIYDSLGFLVGEEPKWGLKNVNDSTLIPPRNKQPVYIENADFNLLKRGRKSVTLNGARNQFFNHYEVISHITGKRLIPEMIISLDTFDLLTRNYARFVSSKGPGVLLGDNSILRVDHIDGHDVNYVRFCQSKKTQVLPVNKRDDDGVRLYDYDVNNDPSKSIKMNIKGKECDFIRYDQAEWNFLDTSGKVVFEEAFDFVETYKFETAIVKKKGRWGVVRADSSVIPEKFASIKRSPISDTLFLVKRSIGGRRYLDTNGRLMSNGMTRLYKNKGNLTQIEWKKNKVLINPNYQLISGETHFQKLLADDIFFSKENKKYTLYDIDGVQLGALPLRPEEVWFEEYVRVKSRGKKGVLSMDRDTLIPFKYRKIEKVGEYIFAQDGAKNVLYDKNLQVIANLKSNSILVDSVSGDFAIISATKAVIRSSKNGKLGSFNGTKFRHFHNGYLIEIGKKLNVYSTENEYVFDFQPKTFQVMGDNGYLVVDSDKIGHYFDQNWKEVEFDEPLTRVKYVGSGRALSRTRSRTFLFGGDVSIELKQGYKNVGAYQSGFLLLEYNLGYEYFNLEGINEFKRTYDEAKPFLSEYATVKEKSGWTIIDRNGHFQILPCFDELTAKSPTIFETSAQPVFGLFDAHGNELIPAEYQQINFLRNDIIQGRKNGDIFYFKRNGEPILLD